MAETTYYKSTRKSGKVAYFSIEYTRAGSDQPGYEYLEVEATIRYIGIVAYEKNLFDQYEHRIIEKRNRVGNTWKMSANKDRCSLNMSVMVHEPYRSYGIGTLVLSEMLKMATDKFPHASMRGTLSTVDEAEDNVHRRNTLYEKRGFVLNGSSFSIDSLDKLHLDEVIPGIENIDITEELLELFEQIETLSYDLNAKKAAIKNDTNSYIEKVREVQSLKKYKYLFYIATIAAIYFMIV
ncbi:hypothetical protein [Sulfuricurvum sp.]|uniref:hypothetical protein n=1 Tax=Sulfuricurvum sp. TaxID=2025608 RepID=UPI002603F6D7|nr:hypothetical protein [Sulfuricurvum sp.]MDD3597440.1 hypothetical protein [Sulfuricurvum sp.]